MAKITVKHHSDFWDREKRVVFETRAVTNEEGGRVYRAVADNVPDDVAREYAENPDQFIVEGIEPEKPADPAPKKGRKAGAGE